MQKCKICELLESDKRSGVCATCVNNLTFSNHLKISKQVSNLLAELDMTLEDITKGSAANRADNNYPSAL